MALANYTDLQASVASWLNRADLTAQIPDFIALAESSIGNDVRLRDMVTTGTLTTVVAQNYVTLPADWLEFIDIRYGDKPLKLVSSNEITVRSSDTDTAMFYAIEGNRLLLAPVPNAVVTLDITYYARLPALSVTPMLVPTNIFTSCCKACAAARAAEASGSMPGRVSTTTVKLSIGPSRVNTHW